MNQIGPEISIRNYSMIHGVRDVVVSENSTISCLKGKNEEDCIFIYKGITLNESMTFKEYQVTNGDVICTYSAPLFKNALSPKSLAQQTCRRSLALELERLKLYELRYMKYESQSEFYRQHVASKMEFFDKLDDGKSAFESMPFFTPNKSRAPSTAPLPMVWRK